MIKRSTRTASLIFSIMLTLQLAAQPNWGSDWKFFRANFIFDKEMIEDQKLKSDVVNTMAWDAEGTAWFAVGGEIKVYENGKIKTIDKKHYGKPRGITALQFDSTGKLWIGTTSGLYFVDDAGNFVYVSVPEIQVVTEVVLDKNDHVYVAGYSSDAINASPGGLSVFDGENWKNYSKKNGDFPKKFVEDITFDKEGNLWMANGVEDNGIAMFNGTEWTFYNKENSGLESNQVRAIAFDSKNNAWFGTPKGLVKYDGTDWTVYSLKDLIMGSMFSNLTKYLAEPDLLSIAIDENDVLWIGTEGQGVIRVQGEGRTVINEENSPLTSNYVRRILVDKFNRKWFLTGFTAENWGDRFFKDLDASQGSFAGAVMYQDPNYNLFEDWKVMNTFTSDQPGNSFYEMQKDKNGAMWLASAAYGLIQHTEEAGWKIYQDPNRGMTGEMLTCIAIGDEKFAGAQMKGLFKVEGDALNAKDQDAFGYGKKSFYDIELDNEGNIWIAHIAGLNKCNSNGGCESFDKKSGLLSNTNFTIKKDSKGRMWIGSTKGLSVYDGGTWKGYTKKENGLKGYVYDVIEDAKGTFWAGTGDGLYKLDGEMWTKVETFGDVPKYLSVKCMAIDQDGIIWIGSTSNAVFTYDGTSWNYYNYENSGVLFGKVWDIEVAANGDVWISVEKGGSVAKQASYTTGGTPATGPDPGYEIKQKIEKFDPSAALVIFKKKK